MSVLKTLTILILIISSTLAASGQDFSGTDSLRHYGGFAHFLLNSHSASFRELKGVPTCCPIFETGSGTGFSAGAFFELPMPYNLRIGLKGVYSTIGATLTKEEETKLIDGNSIITGRFEHLLKTSVSDFGLEPYFTYRAWQGLLLSFGGHAGLTITKNYEYTEKIVSPENKGVFVDSKKRTRNEKSGAIPDAANVYGGIFGGISYEFPLARDNSLTLAPEIIFTAGLSNIARDLAWKASSVRLGLAVRYTSIPEKPKIYERFKQEFKADTIKITRDNVLRKHVLEGITQVIRSERKIGDTIETTEFLYRTDTLFLRAKPKVLIKPANDELKIGIQFVSEAFPILPIIFFDQGSADIPDQYVRESNITSFSIDGLKIDPIVFHKNILNIIGKRLKENPKASISLRGSADSTLERGDCNLALSRAEQIKGFLAGTWGIDEKRLKIDKGKSPCNPLNPTVTRNDSGYAENRRVQISSDDPVVLAPIVREMFPEITSLSSKNIAFTTTGSTSQGIESWEMIIKQGAKRIASLAGEGMPDTISLPLSMDMAMDLDPASPLAAEIYIRDIEGQTAMDSRLIKIFKDTSEYSVERMSLVLFDVGSDRISPEARVALKRFIRGLDEYSQVKVTGFTDALGIYSENANLSLNRAKNTAAVIQEIQPAAVITSVEGVGSSRMPNGINSYATPPERFLSRTVQIENLKKIRKSGD